MSDLQRSLSAGPAGYTGNLQLHVQPPDSGTPQTSPPRRVCTCACGVPHNAVRFGTRVIVDGQTGHYVGFRLPAFAPIEHTIHFDDGGEQIMRGGRCHFLRVVLTQFLPYATCWPYDRPVRGWTVADDLDGGGIINVSTLVDTAGAGIGITSQTTLADFRRDITEKLGVPPEEQRLQLKGFLDGSHEKIRAVLRPDQQTRFDEMRPADPAHPGGPPPPGHRPPPKRGHRPPPKGGPPPPPPGP